MIIDDEKLLADSTAEYFNLFGLKTAAVYTAQECRNFLEKILYSFSTKQVWIDSHTAKLTSLEFKLLSYLIHNKNKVISKQELFEEVWEDKFTGDGTLNVHIRKLREAIEL